MGLAKWHVANFGLQNLHGDQQGELLHHFCHAGVRGEDSIVGRNAGRHSDQRQAGETRRADWDEHSWPQVGRWQTVLH